MKTLCLYVNQIQQQKSDDHCSQSIGLTEQSADEQHNATRFPRGSTKIMRRGAWSILLHECKCLTSDCSWFCLECEKRSTSKPTPRALKWTASHIPSKTSYNLMSDVYAHVIKSTRLPSFLPFLHVGGESEDEASSE